MKNSFEGARKRKSSEVPSLKNSKTQSSKTYPQSILDILSCQLKCMYLIKRLGTDEMKEPMDA